MRVTANHNGAAVTVQGRTKLVEAVDGRLAHQSPPTSRCADLGPVPLRDKPSAELCMEWLFVSHMDIFTAGMSIAVK
jgi:hypothetical protein